MVEEELHVGLYCNDDDDDDDDDDGVILKVEDKRSNEGTPLLILLILCRKIPQRIFRDIILKIYRMRVSIFPRSCVF